MKRIAKNEKNYPKPETRGRKRKTKEAIQQTGLPGYSKKQAEQHMKGEKIDRTPRIFVEFVWATKLAGAEKVKAFLSKFITHTTGKWKGKKFQLFQWQIDLIDKLFGTFKPDGFRQYKQCYLEIAKKNGKTELAAAIGLYLLLADGEGSPEIVIAASDRKQASICFNVAAQMVRQNKRLLKSCKILDSQKKISYLKGNGVLEVVSSETASKHGLNLSGLIFDELHAQKTRDLYAVLTEGSGAARDQPVFLFLTTAGWDRKSICWEVHSHAERVLKGLDVDPSFLPIIYHMPVDEEGKVADWRDEKNWMAPNPALGGVFTIDNLREEFQKAMQIPSQENDFRRLRLNEWTQQQVRWLALKHWQGCNLSPIDCESLRRRVCYGGLDLSSTQDLTAFILLFTPTEKENFYTVVPFFWCPEESIKERSHRDKVPYELWEKQGLMIATPGNVVDQRYIVNEIEKLGIKFVIKEIGYDRFNATRTITDLEELGLKVVPITQTCAFMNSPIKELEKLILNRKINHGGNLVLEWMFNNVSLKQDVTGLVKFDKEKSNEKIDGMVGLAMAMDRAFRNATGKSIYEKQGILVLNPTDTVETPPEPAKPVDEQAPTVEKFLCKRCGKDTEGKDFCKNCGLKRNI